MWAWKGVPGIVCNMTSCLPGKLLDLKKWLQGVVLQEQIQRLEKFKIRRKKKIRKLSAWERQGMTHQSQNRRIRRIWTRNDGRLWSVHNWVLYQCSAGQGPLIDHLPLKNCGRFWRDPRKWNPKSFEIWSAHPNHCRNVCVVDMMSSLGSWKWWQNDSLFRAMYTKNYQCAMKVGIFSEMWFLKNERVTYTKLWHCLFQIYESREYRVLRKVGNLPRGGWIAYLSKAHSPPPSCTAITLTGFLPIPVELK